MPDPSKQSPQPHKFGLAIAAHLPHQRRDLGTYRLNGRLPEPGNLVDAVSSAQTSEDSRFRLRDIKHRDELIDVRRREEASCTHSDEEQACAGQGQVLRRKNDVDRDNRAPLGTGGHASAFAIDCCRTAIRQKQRLGFGIVSSEPAVEQPPAKTGIEMLRCEGRHPDHGYGTGL